MIAPVAPTPDRTVLRPSRHQSDAPAFVADSVHALPGSSVPLHISRPTTKQRHKARISRPGSGWPPLGRSQLLERCEEVVVDHGHIFGAEAVLNEQLDEALAIDQVDRLVPGRSRLVLRLLREDTGRDEDPPVERSKRSLELSHSPGRDLVAVRIPLALDADTEGHHRINPQVALHIDATVSSLADGPELRESKFCEEALTQVLETGRAQPQDRRPNRHRQFDVFRFAGGDRTGRLLRVNVVVRRRLISFVTAFGPDRLKSS